MHFIIGKVTYNYLKICHQYNKKEKKANILGIRIWKKKEMCLILHSKYK